MARTLTLIVVVIVAVVVLFFLKTYHGSNEQTANSKSTLENAIQTNIKRHWHEFTPSSGKFKVSLPGLPQEVYDKIPDPETGEMRRYNTVIASNPGGSAFFISAITFPQNIEEDASQKYLKNVVTNILARNKENKLNYMKESTFKHSRALDFSISSGNLQILGTVFAHENVVYVLSMLSNSATSNKQEYDYFLHSFVLNKQVDESEKT